MQLWNKLTILQKALAAIVVVVLFAIGVMSARAEGVDRAPPSFLPIGEVAKATGWTGVYVGVGGGVQLLDAEASRTFDVVDGVTGDPFLNGAISPLSSTFADTLGGKDWTVDARAGFDLNVPNTPIVLGVLGGHRWGEVEGTFGYGVLGDIVQGTATFSIEQTWYAGGRAGLAYQNWLGYVGYAWTQAEATGSIAGALTVPNGPSGSVSASKSTTLDGQMFLAGAEHILGKGWSVGVEYTYTNYDAFSMSADTVIGEPEDPKLRHTLDVDPDVHAVMLRLNWRPLSK
jgi:opacity protein-like surface antigen